MDDSTDDRDPKLAALIASVRRRCKPGLWSQGVTLARAGAVTDRIAHAGGDRAAGAVAGADRGADGGPLSDGERDGVRLPVAVSPCEHVAAAAIALSGGGADAAAGAAGGAAARRAARGAAAVVERPALARVGYRFTRVDDGLRLARVLVAADGGGDAARERAGGACWPIRRARRGCRSRRRICTADALLGAGAAARRGRAAADEAGCADADPGGRAAAVAGRGCGRDLRGGGAAGRDAGPTPCPRPAGGGRRCDR